MNKDIRLSVGFYDHWKTVVLKQTLGHDAVESLIRLWCFSAQNKPDGILIGMPENAIEIACKWNGEKGALIAALFELRFIERNEQGTICLHDWIEHNGYAAHAKERHEQAVKASEARWKGKGKQSDKNNNAVSNADSIPASNAPSPIPYPSPIPTPTPEHIYSEKSNFCENDKNANETKSSDSLRSSVYIFENNKKNNQKQKPPKPTGKTNNDYKQSQKSQFDRFWATLPIEHRDEEHECRRMWERKCLDNEADLIIADIANRIAKDYRYQEAGTNDSSIKWYLYARKWNNRIIESNPNFRGNVAMCEMEQLPF